MHWLKWRSTWIRWLWMGILVGILVVILPGGGLAQVPGEDIPAVGNTEETTPPTAPVVLDGRTLFSVANTSQITAPERADYVSQELTRLIATADLFEVTWVVREGVPVILVNGGYLMTVTQTDVTLANATNSEELAATWTTRIRTELASSQAERSQDVLISRVVLAIAVFLVTLIVHRLMGRLWRRSLRPAVETITTQSATAETGAAIPTGLHLLLNLLLLLLRGGMWFGVTVYITNLFPVTRRWSYLLRRQTWISLTAPNLRLGQRDFSIFNLMLLVGLLLGLVVLAGVFTNLLRSRILHLAGIDRGSREAVAILTKYSIIFVGTMVLLQIWGLDLSSLALIASALGVGVGLGLQNIAKDFGSGIVLVFERPIQVGDFVEFGSFQGTVERIGARSTEIKTLDQVSLIVPNSRFLEQEIINWSHRNPVSRIRLPVGVSYNADPTQVRDVLLSVSRHHSKVLSMPSPQVFFRGFGDSALNFDLLVWIAEPHQQWLIRSELYFAVELGLRECGIEIPFPQRDLHIRSGQLPVQWLHSPDAPTSHAPDAASNLDSDHLDSDHPDTAPKNTVPKTAPDVTPDPKT